jgi:hypothetical protein
VVRRAFRWASGSAPSSRGCSGSWGGRPTAGEPLAGPPQWWAETLTGFARAGFDTLVFWPVDASPGQVERLVGEVMPLLPNPIPTEEDHPDD